MLTEVSEGSLSGLNGRGRAPAIDAAPLRCPRECAASGRKEARDAPTPWWRLVPLADLTCYGVKRMETDLRGVRIGKRRGGARAERALPLVAWKSAHSWCGGVRIRVPLVGYSPAGREDWMRPERSALLSRAEFRPRWDTGRFSRSGVRFRIVFGAAEA
jgi:hypothetical protein